MHKIDVLIKTFARQCLEGIDPKGELPMATIVAAFQTGKHDDMQALAAAFHAAYTHVYKSVVAALQTAI